MTEPQVCVKDVIKEYEMWNEANATSFWNVTPAATSAQDLYCMAAPAAKIIKANVTGAKLLTPSINAATGYATWMDDWLADEVSGGIISNLYNFHTYLKDSTPETIYSTVVVNQLAPNSSVTGWTALPWLVSETNWDPSLLACDTTLYTVADCTGQVVRWQAILNSEGALNLSWYWWNATIGDLGASTNYATAYYYMMQYMVGGQFTAACSDTTSGGIQTWTCPFTESGGTTALFVWTPTESGTTYTVPTGYVDYKDLSGSTHTVTAGSNITIGVEPFLLEQ